MQYFYRKCLCLTWKIVRKESVKFTLWDILQTPGLYSSKRSMSWKPNKRWGSSLRLKDTKGTWQLNVICGTEHSKQTTKDVIGTTGQFECGLNIRYYYCSNAEFHEWNYGIWLCWRMSLFILRRYMLLYLEVKCHHVFNLIWSDSAKYSCFIYIHMEWETGREKMCSKMLITDEMSFTNEICSIYLTGLL